MEFSAQRDLQCHKKNSEGVIAIVLLKDCSIRSSEIIITQCMVLDVCKNTRLNMRAFEAPLVVSDFVVH